MKIETLRIQNYKSWIDSGELPLHPGKNIVVGQNNAGKSSILEILSLTAGHKPHRSLETVPDQNSQSNHSSKIDITLSFSEGEIMSILRSVRRQYFIPSTQV